MKKKIFFNFLLLCSFFIFVPKTEAHFIAFDKEIGAILHIDPNDDPIAGEQASFFFEFKDKQNKFKPQDCNCTFEIDENGKVIFTQPLFANNQNPSLNNASIIYTLPQKDVYQIKVIGKPMKQNAFQPFLLSWDIRVDQQTTNTTPSNNFILSFLSVHLMHFLVGGASVLFFITYYFRSFLVRKKISLKGGEKKNDKKDNNSLY